MTIFDTLKIAGSGMTLNRTWIDAVGDNISNINTIRPSDEAAYQERFVVAQANDYGSGTGGVQAPEAAFGDAEGRLVYQPDHPYADEEGYVRFPDMDLSDQMVSLVMAQRGYQANIATVTRASEAYRQAIQLGKA